MTSPRTTPRPSHARHLRARRALAKQAAVDTLAALGPRLPWTPLDHTTPAGDRPSWTEWELARLDAAVHEVYDSQWAQGWPRPSPDTAAAICTLMGMDDEWMTLCGQAQKPYDLEKHERAELQVRTHQAAAVALHCALQASRRHRHLTRALLFDALARCWSPKYRYITMTTPAHSIHHMLAPTFYTVRHDLRCAQVDVERLWQWLTSDAVTHLRPYLIDRSGRSGYRIISDRDEMTKEQRKGFTSKHRRLLRDIEDLMADDTCMGLDDGPVSLLLKRDRDAQPVPQYHQWLGCRVAGEQAYNVIRGNWRATALLSTLGMVTQLLDVDAFRADWRMAKARRYQLAKALRRDYYGHLNEKKADTALSYLLSVEHVERDKPHTPTERDIALTQLRSQWKDKPETWQLQEVENVKDKLAQYDSANWIVTQFSGVERRLRREKRPTSLASDAKWYVEICSDYTRTINQRWQPKHFSPMAVSAKAEFEADLYSDDEIEEKAAADELTFAGLRARWFKAPPMRTMLGQTAGEVQEFVSKDMSSSQVQMIAHITGNLALQSAACDPAVKCEKCQKEQEKSPIPVICPFKHTLAHHGWKYVVQVSDTSPDGYLSEYDERLVEMVKSFFMRLIYGSKPSRIVLDHAKEWRKYGSGFAGATHRERLTNAWEFVNAIPGGGELLRFLDICRHLADYALSAFGPYAGLRLHNPYDDSPVRWNPIATTCERVSFGNHASLELRIPLGERAAEGPFIGDYPVNMKRKKNLPQMIAPCFVHMLDGVLSALVMEGLLRRGITSFMAIHDAWQVPAKIIMGGRERDGRDVLDEVLEEALRGWLTMLGPVYRDLRQYTDFTPDMGDVLLWEMNWMHGQGVLATATDPILVAWRDAFWQRWPGMRSKETPSR